MMNFKILIDLFRLNVIQNIINNKVKHFEKKLHTLAKNSFRRERSGIYSRLHRSAYFFLHEQ